MKSNQPFFLFLICGLSFFFQPLKVDAQSLVSAESFVKFKIGAPIGSVTGKIPGIKGTVNFKLENPEQSQFDVFIEPSTINTESKKRDNHLKNEDFFFVTQFPKITFVSTKVEKSGEGYVAFGKLTLLKVTKEVKIPFTATKIKNGVLLKGKFEVNRFDYGLGAKAYSNSFMVGETAKVEIECLITNEN